MTDICGERGSAAPAGADACGGGFRWLTPPANFDAALRASRKARGDFDTALVFHSGRDFEPVIDARPLRIARIEFLVGTVARARAPPRLGGEAP